MAKLLIKFSSFVCFLVFSMCSLAVDTFWWFTPSGFDEAKIYISGSVSETVINHVNNIFDDANLGRPFNVVQARMLPDLSGKVDDVYRPYEGEVNDFDLITHLENRDKQWSKTIDEYKALYGADIVVVVWGGNDDLSGNGLSSALTEGVPSSKHYVTLNARFIFDENSADESTVAHEFGHQLGLVHCNTQMIEAEVSCNSTIMNTTATISSAQRTVLQNTIGLVNEREAGLWTNQNANFNWILMYGGSTPSTNTGPSVAADGKYFSYFETSQGAANKSGDTAELVSPVFPSSTINRVLRFQSHMYGEDIGTLSIDIFHSGTWDNGVWSRSGQIANNWQRHTVDLSQYDGEMKVRFRAIADGGYRGDIAIDDIYVGPSTEDRDVFFEPRHQGYRLGVLNPNDLAYISSMAFEFCKINGYDTWGGAPPETTNIGGSTYSFYQGDQWSISGSNPIYAINSIECVKY